MKSLLTITSLIFAFSICNQPVFAASWMAGTYAEGDRVEVDGKVYECKAWPYTGWCGQRKPGTHGWEEAWIVVSSVSSSYPKIKPKPTLPSPTMPNHPPVKPKPVPATPRPNPQPKPTTPGWQTPGWQIYPPIANPGKPVIGWMSDINASGNYEIKWNMWWGANGDHVVLLENGKVVAQQKIKSNSPNAQSGIFEVTDRKDSTYSYQIKLCNGGINSNKCAQSDSKKVTVNRSSALPPTDPKHSTPGSPQAPTAPTTPTSPLPIEPESATDADLKRIIAATRTRPGIPKVDLGNPSNNYPNVQRVMRIVSEQKWNKIFPVRKSVYTYREFLKAVGKFPAFCNEKPSGSSESLDVICARELATIFAHATQETGGHSPAGALPDNPGVAVPEWQQGLYYIRELGCEHGGCDYRGGTCEPGTWQGQTWPCPSGAQYYGRGAKQLSYNYNYGPFSDVMFGDVNVLLKDPDRIAKEGWLAVSSALWFYMIPQSPKPSMHDMVAGYWKPNQRDLSARIKAGFGATINIINGGIECGGTNEDLRALNRINYYKEFTRELGIASGTNLGCAGQARFPAGGSGSINTYWEKDWGWNARACKLVNYQTPFTIFKDGDYEKCVAHHFGG